MIPSSVSVCMMAIAAALAVALADNDQYQPNVEDELLSWKP